MQDQTQAIHFSSSVIKWYKVVSISLVLSNYILTYILISIIIIIKTMNIVYDTCFDFSNIK